ncbi:hypothetical protein ACOYR1_08330 [Thalassotalea piscium]
MEFIPSLFVALAFDFILYITGAGIIKLVSFSTMKFTMYSYNEFKALKGKTNKGLIFPYCVGILFYLLLIVGFAWVY